MDPSWNVSDDIIITNSSNHMHVPNDGVIEGNGGVPALPQCGCINLEKGSGSSDERA